MSEWDFQPPAYNFNATSCGIGMILRMLPGWIRISSPSSASRIAAGKRSSKLMIWMSPKGPEQVRGCFVLHASLLPGSPLPRCGLEPVEAVLHGQCRLDPFFDRHR